MIAARNESLKNEPERLKTMLEILNRETQRFKKLPKIAEKLAERYDQRLEDIEKWLDITHWSAEQIAEAEVEKVQEKLLELNLISKKQRSSEFIHNL